MHIVTQVMDEMQASISSDVLQNNSTLVDLIFFAVREVLAGRSLDSDDVLRHLDFLEQ